MRLLIELIFGCIHRRCSWPQTPVNRLRQPCGEAYVVCLDCGAEWTFDTLAWKRGARRERQEVAAPVTGEVEA